MTRLECSLTGALLCVIGGFLMGAMLAPGDQTLFGAMGFFFFLGGIAIIGVGIEDG